MKKFFKVLGVVVDKILYGFLVTLGVIGTVAMGSMIMEYIFPNLGWVWQMLLGVVLWVIVFVVGAVLAFLVINTAEKER